MKIKLFQIIFRLFISWYFESLQSKWAHHCTARIIFSHFSSFCVDLWNAIFVQTTMCRCLISRRSLDNVDVVAPTRTKTTEMVNSMINYWFPSHLFAKVQSENERFASKLNENHSEKFNNRTKPNISIDANIEPCCDNRRWMHFRCNCSFLGQKNFRIEIKWSFRFAYLCVCEAFDRLAVKSSSFRCIDCSCFCVWTGAEAFKHMTATWYASFFRFIQFFSSLFFFVCNAAQKQVGDPIQVCDVLCLSYSLTRSLFVSIWCR